MPLVLAACLHGGLTRPARAQDSVLTHPILVRIIGEVRLQFNGGQGIDSTRWYAGTLDSTAGGCPFVTFPGIVTQGSGYADTGTPQDPAARARVSFAHFRALQTRPRSGGPWYIVDWTWIHSRALGCP